MQYPVYNPVQTALYCSVFNSTQLWDALELHKKLVEREREREGEREREREKLIIDERLFNKPCDDKQLLSHF